MIIRRCRFLAVIVRLLGSGFLAMGKTLMQCDTFTTPDNENTERRQEGPPPPILPLAGEATSLLATLDSHLCLTSRIFTLIGSGLLGSWLIGAAVFATGLLTSQAVQAVTVTANPGYCITSAGIGSRAWSSPNNAMASDNFYATASISSIASSNYLICSGYNISIPSDAIINGITVAIERKTSATTVRDLLVRVVKGQVIQAAERATTTSYPTIDTVENHGGASDLWGTTWQASDFNPSDFGVAFAAKTTNSTNRTVSIDRITVTVDYSPPAMTCTPPNNIPSELVGKLTCVCDDFNRASLNPSPLYGSNWIVSNSPSDTTGVLPYIASPGALRLTDNTPSNGKAATIPAAFPAAGNYISVEFQHRAYNGTPYGTDTHGGDGIGFVLSDYSVSPVPGATGSSLGYAQALQGNGSTVNGFAGGWLGVGFDEFGSYQSSGQGHTGGSGIDAVPQSVAARGSGSGTTGYPYLAGTSSLTPGIDALSSTSPAPNYMYQIVVDARNEPASTSIIVNRDTTSGIGTAYSSLISIPNVYNVAGVSQAPVPNYWQLSFAASTGAATNIHEIGRLRICAQTVVPPTGGSSGGFTAIDEAYGDAGGSSKPSIQSYLTGHIYTKIMGTPFQLNVAALSNNQVQTGYVLSGNKYVQTKLVDNSDGVCILDSADTANYCNGSCVAKAAVTGGSQILNYSSSSLGQVRTGNFTLNTAFMKLVAIMRECTTSACAAFTATPAACSVDTFSVRPQSISAVTSSNATNAASSGAPIFKAGGDNFALTATVAGVTGQPNGYNGILKINKNAMQLVAPATTLGRVSPATFPAAVSGTPNATATGTSFTYDEVGAFRLLGYDPATNTSSPRAVFDGVTTATECAGLSVAACDTLKASTWTGVDSVSSKNDCIVDSYANTKDGTGSFSTNANYGKFGCNFGLYNPSAPDTPNSPAFGRFVPHHFQLAATHWLRPDRASCYPTTPISTTGTISSGSNQLTVSNAAGFAVGDKILISGADTAGSDLLTAIQSIAGSTLTLSDKAASNVSGGVVTEINGSLGSITAGSSSLAVANPGAFTTGNKVVIFGAGSGGTPLVTTLSGIAGNTLTLANPAQTAVSNALAYPVVGFTYMDEPMRFTLNLVATNATGGKTRNYAGTLAKLDASNLTGSGSNSWGLAAVVDSLYGLAGCRAVFDAAGNTSYLGTCTALPASVPTAPYAASAASTARLAVSNTSLSTWSYGTAKLTADLQFLKAAVPDGSFDLANGVFSVGALPTDSDGITIDLSKNIDTDATAGADRVALAVTDMRYGRLRIGAGYGSELLPIRLPVTAETYTASSGQWQTNGNDSCTVLGAGNIAIGNCTGALAANCAATSPTLTATTLTNGKTTLILSAPNLQGTADIAINLGSAGTDLSCNVSHPASTAGNQSWLRYNWCQGSSDPNSGDPNNDPNTRIKFGAPRAPYLYLRERY